MKTLSQRILAAWNQAGNFSDIYTQLIKFDGSQSWGVGGVPVTTNDNDQISINIAIDTEKQSAFIVWQDYKNGRDFNIIGKTIALGTGDMFISNELDFTDDTTDQQNPVVYSVSSGEYLIMWEDGRGYNNNDPLLMVCLFALNTMIKKMFSLHTIQIVSISVIG